jgi:hypothetical protein
MITRISAATAVMEAIGPDLIALPDPCSRFSSARHWRAFRRENEERAKAPTHRTRIIASHRLSPGRGPKAGIFAGP